MTENVVVTPQQQGTCEPRRKAIKFDVILWATTEAQDTLAHGEVILDYSNSNRAPWFRIVRTSSLSPVIGLSTRALKERVLMRLLMQEPEVGKFVCGLAGIAFQVRVVITSVRNID